MKIYKPKEEFEQSINIQNAYVELLKNYHKELTEKIKGSKGFQLAKYQLEYYEVATKLDEQIELLREKINHFDQNFIEQYDEELKECKENFEDVLANAQKNVTKNYKKWAAYLHQERLLHLNYIKANNPEILEKEDFGLALEVARNISESKEAMLTIMKMQLQGQELLAKKKKQIGFYIKDWRKVDLKDRNHLEVKNVLYKDLQNLVTFPQI